MKFLLTQLIRFYAYFISPLLGQNCRFHPTCSAYATDALHKHGVLKGLWLAVIRILKCHPWHRGEMIDPVPPINAKAEAKPIAWKGLFGYKRTTSIKERDE